MTAIKTTYDVVVIGGGHNGLVSACYLSKAGLSVLVLERNKEVGGATQSRRVFKGVDVKLSVYSYLVSLFPQKIIDDLDLNVRLKSRATASWNPVIENGGMRELLIRSDDSGSNREAFVKFTGNERDYRGYLQFQELLRRMAAVVWPSLTLPMESRQTLRDRLGNDGENAWQSLIEEPLGSIIEQLISDDHIRGILFTDAKIGALTHPHDPTLLQNRTFLYHVIGDGTGEWRVPVGGMGGLVDQLLRVAGSTGRVTCVTRANVVRVIPGRERSTVVVDQDGNEQQVDARFVLCNASHLVLQELLQGKLNLPENLMEGSGFKMNMVLKKLPRLRSSDCDTAEAFAGTIHINESYEQMLLSYHSSLSGQVPTRTPGELYCHSLADDSILSREFKQKGYHTITLYGLDLPYGLFESDNERVRNEVVKKYFSGINEFLDEPIESCLAKDANGEPCVEAMSAVDLERRLRLPRGNIFHGDLTWPFAESEEEIGQWGVETEFPNILICGSGARRGGAVSGIPGHNAAMKVLEVIRDG